ncbi:CBO0543 family protein [Paenibacillus hamazuiensis]|uniref:CBO0543 family protein n=1 Tax=Paenibacillus hamazuiensis TaxID=2936508 RepID=UPI00200BB515|nr:CBO0543 family protein [Paenibacillus hamazuiensis]
MAITVLVITIVVLMLLTYKMPKKLPPLCLYAAALFAVCFDTLIDFSLNLQLGLFGYFSKGIDIPGYFVIYIIYPLVNITFINFFPFDKGVSKQTLYIIAWSLLALGYEWLSLQVGILYYNQWSIWYSAIAYPVCLLISAGNQRLVRYFEMKSLSGRQQ